MKTELWLFYHNYTWKKCSYDCYVKRVSRYWMTYEQAIVPWHMKQIKMKINDNWKICSMCNEWKYFSYFNKDKRTSTWYTARCWECIRKVMRDYYASNTEKVKESKYKYRKTELWNIRSRLDSIFYRDKNIKKSISLTPESKRKRDVMKWEVTKDKYFYFLNKWYDRKLLEKLYWKYYLNN